MKMDASNSFDSSSSVISSFTKKYKNRVITFLLASCFLGGITFVTHRLLVVVPRQQAQNQALTLPVERQNLAITASANGTIQAERSINVSPKSAGILKNLLVKEGDYVKKWQIIAYMDDSNLQGELTQAKSQIASAEANLQKLIAGNRPQDIAQAEAQLQEVQANLRKLQIGNRPQDIAQAEARLKRSQTNLNQAEDDLRRNQELYQAGAISLQSLNQKRASRDSVQAEVQEAQQALALQKAGARPEDIEQAQAKVRQQQQTVALLKAGSRKEDIEQARAQVNSARGALQTIQSKINDTVIRAPFDGLVTEKYADPGSYVTPNTSGSSVSSALSSSILSLTSNNQVVANLAESNIGKTYLGQKVKIKADAYPEKFFEGKVSQIATKAKVEQNVTSFEVKVAIISDSEKLLRAGMNVDTEFEVSQLKNALVVPTVAVIRQQGGMGVYVMGNDGKPVFTKIETGVTVNDKTEVRSGLKGNERVLITFPEGTRPSSQAPGLLPSPTKK